MAQSQQVWRDECHMEEEEEEERGGGSLLRQFRSRASQKKKQQTIHRIFSHPYKFFLTFFSIFFFLLSQTVCD